jgi:hypothetical protein
MTKGFPVSGVVTGKPISLRVSATRLQGAVFYTTQSLAAPAYSIKGAW